MILEIYLYIATCIQGKHHYGDIILTKDKSISWIYVPQSHISSLSTVHSRSNITAVPECFQLFGGQVALTKPWCVFAVLLDLQQNKMLRHNLVTHFLYFMMFFRWCIWEIIFGHFLLKTLSFSTASNEITSSLDRLVNITIIIIIIIIIIINIYIAQIPCEYVQMRVTKKYYTN